MAMKFEGKRLPVIGSKWRHADGAFYLVEGFSNLRSLVPGTPSHRLMNFPPTISYRSWPASTDPLDQYSTPLSRWFKRFEPAAE
jgi:hypothetical protein